MTRIWALLLGATAAMTFALVVLVAIPRVQLRTLEPDPQVPPYTATQLAGRRIYVSEGCVYCHSQQVRDPSFTYDTLRGWGRPSVPTDYSWDTPHLLGTMRTGPDLINVGSRLPDRSWHLLHLYQPRAVVPWSIMPAFPYLFEVKPAAADGDVVVVPPSPYALPGRVVVARPGALALVDYLLSLDRTKPPVATPAAGAAP
ncbi:cbb3-type cytochrome c oxidase subunit II [Myxococcota bacterium]|nr:cbb3-type cytochrome c oxidase subunit II [Myxococcota bacterium]